MALRIHRFSSISYSHLADGAAGKLLLYYVIDRARCKAGFPAAVYLLHTRIHPTQPKTRRVGDATTVLQAALQPVRANACVTGPRVLGVSNFDVAEPSCKGIVMETRGRTRLRDKDAGAKFQNCNLCCLSRNMLRHNVGKLQRSQYRPLARDKVRL